MSAHISAFFAILGLYIAWQEGLLTQVERDMLILKERRATVS